MTDLDNLTLPDALSPQRFDAHHGRPESYWTERNALVDAVKACPLPQWWKDAVAGTGPFRSHDEYTLDDRAMFDAYRAALELLKAFDAAHGGSPIL